MEIRKAQPQDAAYAAEVESVCFPAAEAASPKAIAERIAAFSDHFWMLWDGETPVGFINGMKTQLCTTKTALGKWCLAWTLCRSISTRGMPPC